MDTPRAASSACHECIQKRVSVETIPKQRAKDEGVLAYLSRRLTKVGHQAVSAAADTEDAAFVPRAVKDAASDGAQQYV